MRLLNVGIIYVHIPGNRFKDVYEVTEHFWHIFRHVFRNKEKYVLIIFASLKDKLCYNVFFKAIAPLLFKKYIFLKVEQVSATYLTYFTY